MVLEGELERYNAVLCSQELVGIYDEIEMNDEMDAGSILLRGVLASHWRIEVFWFRGKSHITFGDQAIGNAPAGLVSTEHTTTATLRGSIASKQS
jgi:hypothetical protein